jgi:hypothetical protein
MTMDQEPKVEYSTAQTIVIGALLVTMILVIVWSEVGDWRRSKAEQAHRLVVEYDCRLAEISVDYPQQVKEQCRKHMMPTVKEFK